MDTKNSRRAAPKKGMARRLCALRRGGKYAPKCVPQTKMRQNLTLWRIIYWNIETV